MDSNIKKLLGLVITLGVLILIVIPLFVFSIIYKKKKNEQENTQSHNLVELEQSNLNLPQNCKVQDILLDNKVFVIKTDVNCNEFAIGVVSNSKISIQNIKKTK